MDIRQTSTNAVIELPYIRMLKNDLAEKVWMTGFTTLGWILKAASNYSFIIVLSPLIVENLPLPKIEELSLHSQRNFALAIESLSMTSLRCGDPCSLLSMAIKNLLVNINMPADFCVSSSIEWIDLITIDDWGLQGVLEFRTLIFIITIFATGSYAMNKAGKVCSNLGASLMIKIIEVS